MRNFRLTPIFGARAAIDAAACALAVFIVVLASPPSRASALAQAQAQGVPSAPSALRTPAVKLSQASSAAKTPAPSTKPSWADLSSAQQQALAPLAAPWNTINEAQKRKWLALSRNYPSLPAAEQAMMHSRMTEWAALSPQQRTQARLNFAETKQLAPDDKKAKWEAYKALAPEQKRRFAADAPTKTPGTAAAVKPVPAQKLATVPRSDRDVKTPRIAIGPPNDAGALTLQPGPAPAPAPFQTN